MRVATRRARAAIGLLRRRPAREIEDPAQRAHRFGRYWAPCATSTCRSTVDDMREWTSWSVADPSQDASPVAELRALLPHQHDEARSGLLAALDSALLGSPRLGARRHGDPHPQPTSPRRPPARRVGPSRARDGAPPYRHQGRGDAPSGPRSPRTSTACASSASGCGTRSSSPPGSTGGAPPPSPAGWRNSKTSSARCRTRRSPRSVSAPSRSRGSGPPEPSPRRPSSRWGRSPSATASRPRTSKRVSAAGSRW